MTKILVIDDEEANVRVLSISLKSDGYDVAMAYSGEEGLEVFKKESPEIVLTDLKMPGMDGIEVLGKIKAFEPDAEVIIITGHGDIDSAIEALKYGASDFINKPIRDEALSIALQRAKEKLEIRKKLKEYTVNLENEVKIATRELWRRSNFLNKLITSSNDGIVATDEEFKIVIFNPGAEKIFGHSRSEAVDRMDIAELYPPEIVEAFKGETARSRTKGGLPWKETVVLTKDGEKIPVRFSGTPLYESDKMMGSVGFFHDLRDIKQLEKGLVSSERLAAVGQTTAGLAHYIKNILSGLKGGSYNVNVGLDKNDTDKLKTGWKSIERNIGRISDLVMDLLSFSKERGAEYESCYPNDIVNDACELLKEKAQENKIEVIKDFDPSIGAVSMDPRTIHRTLLNLVSNAIDACLFDEDTGKNWRVAVKTTREKNGMISFEVQDNGCGMNAVTKDKLFTSFFSTKGGQGTGLGLLVTKKLVDEHEGTVNVTSQPGTGTIFTVQLPYRELNTD